MDDGEYRPSTVTAIEPWPPRAGDTCKTPFVIAFRFGHDEKIPQSFPRAAGVLAKLADVGDAKLEAVLSGGRKVFGVRAAGWDAARRIGDALGKELKITPEIVCADPEALR